MKNKFQIDLFKATFRGRELLYPEPYGEVTAGADKDYPVDYSHLNIMGYALGAPYCKAICMGRGLIDRGVCKDHRH